MWYCMPELSSTTRTSSSPTPASKVTTTTDTRLLRLQPIDSSRLELTLPSLRGTCSIMPATFSPICLLAATSRICRLPKIDWDESAPSRSCWVPPILGKLNISNKLHLFALEMLAWLTRCRDHNVSISAGAGAAPPCASGGRFFSDCGIDADVEVA